MPWRAVQGAALCAVLAMLVAMPSASRAADDEIARGEYLVKIMSCGNCHTDGYFIGEPDMARYLAGSQIGLEVPGLGIFYGRNLTPDVETGLGGWTDEEVAHAIRTGERPDGRILAPVMPYENFAHLTDADVAAIVAYLRSLPPVRYNPPGPVGPGEKAPSRYLGHVIPE